MLFQLDQAPACSKAKQTHPCPAPLPFHPAASQQAASMRRALLARMALELNADEEFLVQPQALIFK